MTDKDRVECFLNLRTKIKNKVQELSNSWTFCLQHNFRVEAAAIRKDIDIYSEIAGEITNILDHE